MKKLTKIERCKISALHEAGKRPSDIAKQLGRSASTITRELQRNREDGEYNFEIANSRAIERRGQQNKGKITEDNWTYVRSLLRQKWSPAQIDGWLKVHPEVGFTVSRESIYQYVKIDKEASESLNALKILGRPCPLKSRIINATAILLWHVHVRRAT